MKKILLIILIKILFLDIILSKKNFINKEKFTLSLMITLAKLITIINIIFFKLYYSYGFFHFNRYENKNHNILKESHYNRKNLIIKSEIKQNNIKKNSLFNRDKIIKEEIQKKKTNDFPSTNNQQFLLDSFIREEIQEKKIPSTNNQQFLLDSFIKEEIQEKKIPSTNNQQFLLDSFIREEIQEKKIPTTNNQQFLLDSFKNELYDIYKNYHLHHIIHEEILKYVSQDDYLKKKINKLKFCLIQNAKYDGDHERYDNISLGINYRYFSGVEPWSVLVFELEKVPADGLCGFHSGDLTLQEIIDYLNKNKNNWKIQKFFFDYNIDFINHELNNNNALNDFFHKETQFQSIKELSLAYKPSYVDSEETKEYSIKYNEITKKENLYLLENFNKAFIELIFKKRIWIEHGILKFYIKKIKKKTSIIYSDKLIPMEKFSPIDYKLIYIYCGNEAMNIKNLYNKIINNEIANIFYNGYNHFDQLKYIRTIPGSTIFPYLQSLK